MTVPLVAILAAGRGVRFGGDKLDAPCAGRALGGWALRAVAKAGLPPGIIVTGPDIPVFACNSGWAVTINADPAAGLAGSLRIAAEAAAGRRARALLIVLADMPLIAPEMLRQLTDHADAPAAAMHPNGPGVPAIFPRHLYSALLSQAGDRGAARLLTEQPDLRVIRCDPVSLYDVDTPAALREAERLLKRRAVRP